MMKRVGYVLNITAILLLLLQVAGGYVLAGTPTPNEVDAVARTLYCPLCVGQRLDTCEIPLCQDMKKEIARQLAEGRTPEELRAYFVEQYGPVVLGEPPRRGVNWLAWVIPIIVLLAGAGYAGMKVREWSRAQTAPVTVPTKEENAKDAYLEQVERDLSQLE